MYVGATGHVVSTLLDKDKGSMTNRWECAKEHAKNDFTNGSKILLTSASVAGLTALAAKGKRIAELDTALKTAPKIFKPNNMSKVCQAIYKGMGKLGNGIGKVASKLGAKGLAEKIMKNPTKAGLAGIALAAGLYILNKTANYFTQKGRIDQKYEDAAKIESQTKNIVLENLAAMQLAQKCDCEA